MFGSAPAAANFNETDDAVVGSDNIDLAEYISEIALQNRVAVFTQEFNGLLFTRFSGLNLVSHRLSKRPGRKFSYEWKRGHDA